MRPNKRTGWPVPVALALFVVWTGTAAAQIRYQQGQSVVPAFEGWERNADGTYTLRFGYMNRNYEEQPHIPIGAANFFEPGSADRGQPTHFYNRRQLFVFSVVVPADWGEKELVWTLTNHGITEKAYGSLLPSWEIDQLVIRHNRGGGAPVVEDVLVLLQNQPPSIQLLGLDETAIPLSEAVTLSVSIGDDGIDAENVTSGRQRDVDEATAGIIEQFIPKRQEPSSQSVVRPPPPDQRPGVTWVHYRGPGRVIFGDMRPRLKEGKARTTARFTEPGTYVLRAYADDGALTTPADVTVTVTP